MNSPKPMQNSDLNDKVLCCCYFVQKYIELNAEKDKKQLEDIAHDQKDMENSDVPVMDATAKTINISEDNGTISRGDNSKSKKSPKEITSTKRLQTINNESKLRAKGKEADDKEI